MALIKCPECSKEVSDSALTCPNCGYQLNPSNLPKIDPASNISTEGPSRINQTPPKKKKQ
jgi:hypothetical protein